LQYESKLINTNGNNYNITKLKEYKTQILSSQPHFFRMYKQWLKCNGTQGNAVPLPPIYG